MDKQQAVRSKDPVKELVGFLAGLRKADNLIFADLPPSLADLVRLSATRTGQSEYRTPPSCREITSKVLEKLRLECFQELQAQTEDLNAIVPHCMGLVLVKGYDLARGLKSLYVSKSLPSVIETLAAPGTLHDACPYTVPPELLENLALRIESFPNKQGVIRTTAWDDLKKGRELLSQKVLKAHLAEREHLAALEEQPEEQGAAPPQSPPSPEPERLLPALPDYYVSSPNTEEVVEVLVPARSSGNASYQVVVLHGGPGVGKTTLASAIAQNKRLHQFFADRIHWVSLSQKAPQALLHDICHQIDLQSQDGESVEQLRQRFEGWTAEQTAPALFILDDVQSAEELNLLLPAGNQAQVLITCQDRRAVESAIWERWKPTTEKVFWLHIQGLDRDDGRTLIKEWQIDTLSPEEEHARENVGELVHWHPMALRHYAAEARHIGWLDVEKLVLQGNHDPESPFFYKALNDSVQRSLSRLSEGDRQALLSLKGAFHPISTFGVGAAGVVWNQEPHQIRARLRRLESQGLIEAVAQEPWPLQDLIQRTYRGRERYRLMPILRQIAKKPGSGETWYTETGRPSRPWRRAIRKRAKQLPPGPGQVRWQFWLAAWLVLVATTLLRIAATVGIRLKPSSQDRFGKWKTPEPEERMQDLWDRQGLLPPAEIWMALQKTQWTYYPSGHLLVALLLTFPLLVAVAGWIIRVVRFGQGICFVQPTVLVVYAVLAYAFFRFSVRPQAWWLWLLGLYEQEFRELHWTRRLAQRLGLRNPIHEAIRLPNLVEPEGTKRDSETES